MNNRFKTFPLVAHASLFLMLCNAGRTEWNSLTFADYSYYYTSADSVNNRKYLELIDKGIKETVAFFGKAYKSRFSVYVHPDRSSLDSTWQKEWNQPGFKSACWMVASGVADRLHMISPVRWSKEACEHDYAEREKTQQLITHELVHVYHGQFNRSPDFNDTQNIDWFVEGLATYASGQCNKERINEVKEEIKAGHAPKNLNDFWTGKLRYGLSGSVVMYIDKTFGREKIRQILKYNKKDEILNALGIPEVKLLNGWSEFILKFKTHG